MTAETLSAPLGQVLVCTDGSPYSQGAMGAALELARTAGSKLMVLEVLPYIPGFELQSPEMLGPPIINLELLAAQEAAVRQRLESWKTEVAAPQGVTAVELRVRRGLSPYDAILEEARALKPDLVILGRRGLTGLSRLLMGSVTARVIGHSTCPVLVVPKDAGLSFKRIMAAGDGSPYSEAAWETALSLAQSQKGVLLAVTVARDDREMNGAMILMQHLEASAARRGLPLETQVLTGRPFEAIVQASEDEGATLIILGSHGRTGLKKLLMGSVAERVIGHARCPVMVVKRG